MAKANIRDGVLTELEKDCPAGNVSDKIMSILTQLRTLKNLSYIAITSDVVPILATRQETINSLSPETTDAA